jgi:hypothetical protein
MVNKGFESREEIAQEVLTQVSYRIWREANPDDTCPSWACGCTIGANGRSIKQ